MTAPTWFRAPTDDDAGTLNACYDALDLHVVRGHADEVALSLDGVDHTYAWLLTEVAACAGVLRAFAVGVGDQVALGAVPRQAGVIVVLAAARLGAVVQYDDSAGAEGKVVVRTGAAGDEEGVVFGVDGEDLPWDVAMRAGRTDPAGCDDVPGDAVLARHAGDELTVLAALGASDDHKPTTPAGATLIEVGGLAFWSFDPPA